MVGLSRGRATADAEDPLEELALLARAAGGRPVAACIQRAPAPHPQTYVGAGKLQEVARLARAHGADLVLADDDLTPSQVRHIEQATGVRTIDRSELILAIFAQRARTREARDQVELAQLEYLLPRLRGMWTHLEKIRGGIGMRGPGEKQIEMDRRLIDRRIEALRARTREILARRDRQIESRGGLFTVALVGYTNAGKSTLMNRLTGAAVSANDRLFETLATRTSRLRLPHGGEALVSDTVGFIRKLPHHLVASFRATLAEAQRADLLLHVVDASALAPLDQIEASERVLDSLGCDRGRVIVVANKIDKPEAAGQVAWLSTGRRRCIAVSAATGAGIPALLAAIEEAAERRRRTLHLTCSPAEGALLAALRRKGRILSEGLDAGARYRVKARLAPSDWLCIRPLGRDKIRARWTDGGAASRAARGGGNPGESAGHGA